VTLGREVWRAGASARLLLGCQGGDRDERYIIKWHMQDNGQESVATRLCGIGCARHRALIRGDQGLGYVLLGDGGATIGASGHRPPEDGGDASPTLAFCPLRSIEEVFCDILSIEMEEGLPLRS